MLDEALLGLRDVGDVHGSFVIGQDGQLLARDLPAVFTYEIFDEVGPRLVRLRETLEIQGDDMKSVVLTFPDHKLHLRPVGPSLLCIITGLNVNAPALRMALNLVEKRVKMAAETPGPPRTSAPPRVFLTQSPPQTSALPAEPPKPTKREVMYRGRKPG
ncbi:MAG TPA: roadblock/LC7 domain-containing protein [Polyangiaceae bacterium]|nr:roadblock/LC7 domain-containing protein [Polyangiaceae bacterium]